MVNKPWVGLNPIAPLLPLRSVVVTLEMTESATPGFFHHIALHAWLRTLTGSPKNFSEGLIVEPLENGHISYQEGDYYRFRLTAVNTASELLEHILEALAGLPCSAKQLDSEHHFHQNLRLYGVVDAFTGEEIESYIELSGLGIDALAEHTQLWEQHSQFKIRSTTPIRVLLPNKDGKKGTSRYCRNAQDFNWELFWQRVTDSVINLIKQSTGVRYSRPECPNVKFNPEITYWVDHRYAADNQKKSASGALFILSCEAINPIPRWAWALIILGQYIGVGQGKAFGLGLYQLVTTDGKVSAVRPGAAHALLHRFMSGNRIHRAWSESASKGKAPKALKQGDEQILLPLRELAQQVVDFNYNTPELTQVTIEKPDGGERLLSVPPWQDRVLQRAVASGLSESFEYLWMEASYGYRKGHSRFNACDNINQLIAQGYNWVLESDIDSFFDTVDWLNLENRLRLLFPNEPLVDQIMNWVKAPVRTEDDQRINRTQGLPQGAPISPELANLLLDDFDADMHALDYKLVRFADDFVLLFKTREEAETALSEVHTSLIEHGFRLKPSKTRIVNAKQGFRYLGFLFIDGYAIEISREYRKELKVLNEQFKQAPADNKYIKGLDNLSEPNPRPDKSVAGQMSGKLEISERNEVGTLLIVAGDIAVLSCHQNKLQVSQHEEDTLYSWHSLSSIMLVGPHQVTTPALRKAMAQHVPIHFVNRFGEYQGCSSSIEPGLSNQFWLLQTQCFQNQTVALECAKKVVLARLQGMRSLIKRRDPNHSAIHKYRRISDKISQCKAIDVLRGFEGEASKLYWQYWQECFKTEWGFEGRKRRPPPDPINALLSLGYSFVYHLTDSINRSVGFYPWQGFYHQTHGNHKTLASDLMEPFRLIVERVVITLINRRQIKQDDFAITDNGCEMSSNTRKLLLAALLQDISQAKSKGRVLDEFYRQALSLRNYCQHGTQFIPWKPG